MIFSPGASSGYLDWRAFGVEGINAKVYRVLLGEEDLGRKNTPGTGGPSMLPARLWRRDAGTASKRIRVL